MKKLYSTKATVVGGRAGTAKLSDSDLVINMAMPGSGKEGNNPEQLFAMGYGACFDGALGVVKQMQNLQFDSTLEIEVDLLQDDNHGYNIAAKLHVIASNTTLSAEEVKKAVDTAHQICPYSKATRGNIDVEISSEVK
ncbi:organic hydroperoxide resistance protein [Neisseria montereyensis]|uniref:Organic hydroperoxide resistance protein n=1 Tax=Neisseria montereyensis TaxID=2973938 RepID=A0ABT2FBT7_9NEIS|nr:organic hydroperoxide resistance protein [Neisseria montereyensis]MCS4533667.1 organic hydroperoxide resistance protein [Neisseria montereyensis]